MYVSREVVIALLLPANLVVCLLNLNFACALFNIEDLCFPLV
jgi:hypothetical protein